MRILKSELRRRVMRAQDPGGDARHAAPSPAAFAAFAAAAASEATWLTAKRFLKMHDINKCLMRLLPMQLRQSAVHSAKILAFGAGLRDCPHGTFEPSFSLRCPLLTFLLLPPEPLI